MIKYPILSYKYHVSYPIQEIIIYKSRASQKVEANKNFDNARVICNSPF